MLTSIIFYVILTNYISMATSLTSELTNLTYFFKTSNIIGETINLEELIGFKIDKLVIDLIFTHYVETVIVRTTKLNVEITTELADWKYQFRSCHAKRRSEFSCKSTGSLIEVKADHFVINDIKVFGYKTYSEIFYGCFTIHGLTPSSRLQLEPCLDYCKLYLWSAINIDKGCVCFENLSLIRQESLRSCKLACPDISYSSCGGESGEYSIYSINQYMTDENVVSITKKCAMEFKKKSCPRCQAGRRGIRCNKLDCGVNKGGCKRECQNDRWPGNVSRSACFCGSGFYLSNDRDCLDIDECQTILNDCDKNTTFCNNKYGYFGCQCKIGYNNMHIKKNKKVCLDFDECLESTCGKNTSCVNTIGSYLCQCNEGYQDVKINSTVTCVDIDECVFQVICDKNTTSCQNTQGDFECSCLPGYKKKNRLASKESCIDIDECGLPVHPCIERLGQCKNTIGSYTCHCGMGLISRNDSIICEDIDECKLLTICNQNTSICQNLIGNYRCVCREGYIKVNSKQQGSCVDMDECELDKCGKSNCVNTPGSFFCTCPEGYKFWNYSHLIECEDIDECSILNSCDLLKSVCVNMKGTYTCICTQGYANVDNTSCTPDKDSSNKSVTTDNDIATHIIETSSDAIFWLSVIATSFGTITGAFMLFFVMKKILNQKNEMTPSTASSITSVYA